MAIIVESKNSTSQTQSMEEGENEATFENFAHYVYKDEGMIVKCMHELCTLLIHISTYFQHI
jgi:hypothetical protein